jgi:hypothetical protein
MRVSTRQGRDKSESGAGRLHGIRGDYSESRSNRCVAGIEVDPGGTVLVENTKISHNATYGIFAQGTVTLANSDISFNTSSINGSTFSYGNNRIFDNGPGNAPTLIAQQ